MLQENLDVSNLTVQSSDDCLMFQLIWKILGYILFIYRKNSNIRRYNFELNRNEGAERVTRALSMLMHLRSTQESLQFLQPNLPNRS